jgi:hypothetical protein
MLRLSDRVKEGSITTGSGNIILNGPFRGSQSFANGIGHNNTTYYAIENGSDYEVGIGVYDSGNNSLSRNIVLESSNDDKLLNLSGTSIVFCTYPAYHSVFLNEHGYISGQLPYYSGIALPDGTVLTSSIDGNGATDKIAYWQDPNTLSSINSIDWNSSSSLLSISGNLLVDGDVNVNDDLNVSGNLLVENNLVAKDSLTVSNDINVSGDIYTNSSSIYNLSSIDVDSLTVNTSAEITNPDLRDTLFYRTSAGCFFHAYVDNASDNMIALYSSNETNPYWRLGIKSYSTNYTTQPTTGYVEAENGQAGLYATSQNYLVITSSNGFWVGHDNASLLNIQRDEGVRVFNDNPSATAFTIRGASAQANYLQEWSTYTSETVASLNKDGQIAIDSVRFADGTVQSTAASSSTENYKIVSSNATLLPDDAIVFVECSNDLSLNLPTASGVGGKKMTIKRKPGYGDNLLTILPSGSELIDGDTSFSIDYDNQSISLVSDNLNWYII